MNQTSNATLTSPVIVDAAGNDWTSEEAQARREYKAWKRANGRRQEEAGVRELQVTADLQLIHTAGDENSFDLSDWAWTNMGAEAPVQSNYVDIDDVPAGFTIWDMADNGGSEMDEDECVELISAARLIQNHPVVTELGVDPMWLLSEDGTPMGANSLALLETVIRDAILVCENWEAWCNEIDPWKAIEQNGQRLQKAADSKRQAQAAQAKREAELEATRQSAIRRAEAQARKAEADAKRAATASTQKVDTDWMGRVQGPSGELLYSCTGQVRPRYGNGSSRPCGTRGPANLMVVGTIDSMSRRQGGNVVEVWHLSQHALCPTCAAHIAQGVERKSGHKLVFQTIEAAIAEIETEERQLKGNNTLRSVEGTEGSHRDSRFCVQVDWAKDESWKGFMQQKPRTPAEWNTFRESLNLGSLNLASLSKKLIPAWTCENRTDVINWWRLVKLETEQRAWQDRQREQQARKAHYDKRRQQQRAQA